MDEEPKEEEFKEQTFEEPTMQNIDIDSFYNFHTTIINPKAGEFAKYFIRDIKLSRLNNTEKTMCLELLRRIDRLENIGNYEEILKIKKLVKRKGELVETEMPFTDKEGNQIIIIKNRFPKSLEIYKTDLFAIVNVASATDGFEAKEMTARLTGSREQQKTTQPEKKFNFAFWRKKK